MNIVLFWMVHLYKKQVTEKAFIAAGKAQGLELWRIEKLAPVKMKVTGKFHTGDSYILLSTTVTKSGALNWAIHFWLGAETSSDEAGIAAYKTVELDDLLGGGPIQYREVQGNESQLFLSYFKNTGGIEYLPGGVESGFKKVERDVFPTRLLQCKGKRTVRVTEVPLAIKSLNKGDVFILDAGFKIFVFDGPEANKYEKAKGLEVANNINIDERGSRAQIILMKDELTNPDFWSTLGGKFIDPANLPAGESDDSVQTSVAQSKLFKISDASGSIEFTEVLIPSGNLVKGLLDGNDVFLLHAPNKLYLWIGRHSNITEKKEATARAVEYMKKNNLPTGFPLERVSEGSESASFKSEFVMWDPPKAFGIHKAPTGAEDNPLDVAALLSRKAAEDTPVDDGSGKLKIWVINDFKKVELSPSVYGEFNGGDSYILLYTYQKNRKEESIIYFWLGNDSSLDEKGAAALLVVEMDNAMGGKAVQVRVTQGKEPAHFRQLFKGRMIVYKGGHTSGFHAKMPATVAADPVALFHVRGTNAMNTIGLQVDATASSLNSEDSFVLVTPSHVYTWLGRASNESEHAVAMNIATILSGKYNGTAGRLIVKVTENSEPAEFWTLLGGKTEYPSVAPGEAPPRDPRLFSASSASGRFTVEEVENFDQSDLNDEDVYLLDTFTQLFVWIGSQSTAEERAKAKEVAHRYIAEAKDGRDPSIPIIEIRAGSEPVMFTCHFFGWDPNYLNKQIYKDPYQAKLDAMATENAKKTGATTSSSAPAAPAASAIVYASPISTTFSYEDLKANKAPGADPSRKEEYLDAASFSKIFGMEKAAFSVLPKWKKDDLKKKSGLF